MASPSTTAVATRQRVLLGVLPLSTGAALVTLIVARVSMPLAALVVVGVGVTARRLVMRGLDDAGRGRVTSLTKRGLAAGLVATLAYDATRFGIVAVVHWDIRPFFAIPRFGQQFVGADGPAPAQWLVGLTYHLLNGVGFAVAYSLVIRRPRWRTAVMWALALEVAMVLMYPQWLGINVTKEFTMVSLGGHLSWGTGLAAVLHATAPRTAASS